MHKSTTLRIFYLFAALFLFFFLQHNIPLWSSDEGRYGEIAREMLESGDYIIPHFNYIPFLDKPILAPVLTSLFYHAFGVSAFSTRLVSITAALLGILVLYRFAKKIFDRRTADLSAVFLLTTVGYVLVGRFAVIDMLLTFCLSVCLLSFFRGFYEKKSSFYLWGYVFMGLGFLAKGLIGIVLPAGIFFMFLLWSGNLKELLKMKIHWGILIVAAIILPWLITASLRKSDFFQSFIIEQHFQRFTTSTFGRRRPFWFFVPILLALGLPWTLFLPAAAREGFRQTGAEKLKFQFLLCWLLGILIFFSIPKSKLPYYILPATMPLVLIISSFFSRFLEKPSISVRWIELPWKIVAFSALPLVIGLGVYLQFFAHKLEIVSLKNFGTAGAAIVGVGLFGSNLLRQKKGLRAGLYGIAFTFYAGILFAVVGMKLISPIQSTSEAVAFIQELGPDVEAAIFSSPDRFSDFPFHSRKRVIIVGSDHGTAADQIHVLTPEQKHRYYPETGEYILRFQSKKTKMVCLMEEDRLRDLNNSGLIPEQYRILKHESGKVIIANFGTGE